MEFHSGFKIPSLDFLETPEALDWERKKNMEGQAIEEKMSDQIHPDLEDGEDKIEKARQLVFEIISQLLEKMNVDAKVVTRIVDPEDDKDHPIILADISGKDLSILIGRKSETLNSLQYITSLILCNEIGGWIPLMVDVQGYRYRRERQLRQLARRIADQVVQTGRTQVLEPMPANERRIIHLELRYHPFVTTQSIGEEPNRRATILLKPRE